LAQSTCFRIDFQHIFELLSVASCILTETSGEPIRLRAERMTFLNPLLLFGLAAAALPILIHLLNLRKLRVVEFSSLRFLKELQHTRIRRVKIKQILLLIIRTLLILFMVLAFARPAIQGNLAGLAATEARSTMVVLLDDSPSMGLRTQEGIVFHRAKDLVRGILSLANPADRIYVFALSEASGGRTLPPGRSVGEVNNLLSSLEPSHVSVPVREALHAVAPLLAEADNINREVYLVTDVQRTQFLREEADSAGLLDAGVRIFLVPVPHTDGTGNRGIAAVTSNAQVIGVSRPLTCNVRLVNDGPDPAENLLLSVYLDGTRVAQRSVSLPAGTPVSSPVSMAPKRSGLLTGTAELEEDPFELDNRRYFIIDVPRTIRVGIVGTAGETRFLSLALSAASGAGFGELFSVTPIDESAIGSANLATYDALVIAGITSLSREEGQRVAGFVTSGGGVAFFPGPSTDLSSVNTALCSALNLPPLGGWASPNSGESGGFLSFGKVDLQHPLFSGLFEERIGRSRDRGNIESPRIRQLLRTEAGPGGNTIIECTNGSPFLIDYGVGSGRVLMFSVDAGTAWSDFALKGIFAPLVNRAVMYLVTGRNEQGGTIVGEPAVITLRTSSARGASYMVAAPDGLIERVSPEVNPLTGVTSFQLPATRVAGIYQLYREGAADTPIGAVAVNIDERESLLAPASEEDLRTFFRSTGIDEERVVTITDGAQLERVVDESRYGVELWKTMLAIALVLAVVEMAVARVSRADTALPEAS